MSVVQFIPYAVDGLFTLIFVGVLVGAIRRPRRLQFQATLFFGAVTFILIESAIISHLGNQPSAAVRAINQIVLVSLSYLLLRLVDSLSDVPKIVFRIGEAGLVLLAIQAVVGLGEQRFPFVIPSMLYFLFFAIYAMVIAIKASREVGGVTKQRLRAVALGSSLLASVFVVARIGVCVPSLASSRTHLIDETLVLLCGISYFIAFSTPLVLRRAWLEPVMREFFAGALSLSHVADRREMLTRLEEHARDSLGGTVASIALWDEQQRELVFPTGSIGIERGDPEDMIEGAALFTERAAFSPNLLRDYSRSVSVYLNLNANSVVSAPVVARGHCYGVLSVYFSGSLMFVEDDLTLLKLMADQVGVVLESRAVAEEEARLHTLEEALKLRNDFLASVTHDLKTPLTALVMQTQLLERRARKSPHAPADREGLHQIIVQTHRLRSFIEDLLDVQRSEDEGLVLNYEPCDLVSLVREVGERVCVQPHRFVLEAELSENVVGDRARLTQLFDNLIGNAVKYSPDGGEIHTRIWREGDDVHTTVSDQGIGISESDLPHVFERHHRGDNANVQAVHGIGLGLFICRAIVQAHGGRLEVESASGEGSTFHIFIPCEPMTQAEPRIGPRLLSKDSQPELTGDIALQG